MKGPMKNQISEKARKVPTKLYYANTVFEAVCEPSDEDLCKCCIDDMRHEIMLYDKDSEIYWWLLCRSCEVEMSIMVMD